MATTQKETPDLTDLRAKLMQLTKKSSEQIVKKLETRAGPGGGSEVRVFAPDGSIVRDFSDLAVDPSDGVNVAFAPATGQIVTDGLSSDFSQRNVSLNAASLAGTQSTVVTTTTASLPGSTAPLQGSDTVPLQGSDTAPLQGSDTTPLQPTSGSVPLS